MKLLNRLPPVKSRWFTTLIALASGTLLLTVLTLWADAATPKENQPTKPTASKPLVSTINIKPQTYQAEVQVLAEVLPRWQTEIKTFVSGEIIEISEKVLAGNRVTKGELLVKIEASAYKALVADAENQVHAANVHYLKVQRAAQQAIADWQRSGLSGEPDSPLTLYEPQLAAAKAELLAAKAQLNNAQKQLQYTQVTAPFSGVVVNHHISPGEAVDAGQPLLEIMNLEQLDITIKLSEAQWALLPGNIKETKARLRDPVSNQQWEAKVDRDAGFLDRVTRQRILYLVPYPAPDKSNAPLPMPGQVLEIQLFGKVFNDLLALPESALTRDGYIWSVDPQQRLQRHRANLLFRRNNQVFLEKPVALPTNIQVAILPMESFLPGKSVQVAGGN